MTRRAFASTSAAVAAALTLAMTQFAGSLPAAPVATAAESSAPTTAESPFRGDRVLRTTRPADRLSLPDNWTQARAQSAARLPIRYALSYVAIPVRGQRLGFAKSGLRAMTARVSQRMSTQTDGRFAYGMVGYRVAPTTTDRALGCNLDAIHSRYRKYATGLGNPPPGYRDTVAIYLTPIRMRCPYAGVALLRGNAVYLNGLDLQDPQRLQDWITAHELGHTLGLEHSASFWRALPDWTFADTVPQGRRTQDWQDYGDYLDLMGQPPRQGYSLNGARFDRWTLNSLSLAALGVFDRDNVTYIRRSGRYSLPQLLPDDAGGPMMLAIPVIADDRRTFWVLEYRPATQNDDTMNYPEPWATKGYGVRLMLAPKGLTYPNFMNRVFHVSGAETALAALPVGTTVRLGGGARVTVVAADGPAAIVDVTVP